MLGAAPGKNNAAIAAEMGVHRAWITGSRAALTERLRADLTVAYRPPQFTGEPAQLAAALRRLPDAE